MQVKKIVGANFQKPLKNGWVVCVGICLELAGIVRVVFILLFVGFLKSVFVLLFCFLSGIFILWNIFVLNLTLESGWLAISNLCLYYVHG